MATRGQRAAESPVVSAGGKRRATKEPKVPLRFPISGLSFAPPALRSTPSAAALIGAAALVVAAAGAVSVSQGSVSAALASGSPRLAGQASALTGVSTVSSSSVISVRERALSRDSERQALADASNEDLEAAAEEQWVERNAAVRQLAASAERRAAIIAKNAWQLPVEAGVYHLTSRFGECSALWAHCHTGLDFAAPTGTPIHSIANGVVTDIGWAGAYGNRIIVTLSDGTEIWYAHQSAFAVGLGDNVVGGQVIGYIGATGNTTGPHLHLEVRPGAGDPVDPYTALIVHGVHP